MLVVNWLLTRKVESVDHRVGICSCHKKANVPSLSNLHTFLVAVKYHYIGCSIPPHFAMCTSGTGFAYPSGAPEFTPGFYCLPFQSTWVHPRFLVGFVLFVLLFDCCSFVLFRLVIVRFMDSEYPFGIFKLFLAVNNPNLLTFVKQIYQ